MDLAMFRKLFLIFIGLIVPERTGIICDDRAVGNNLSWLQGNWMKKKLDEQIICNELDY